MHIVAVYYIFYRHFGEWYKPNIHARDRLSVMWLCDVMDGPKYTVDGYCDIKIWKALIHCTRFSMNVNTYFERNNSNPSNGCILLITHYRDVIMGTIASQITSLTIVCSTAYSDTDQRQHQSSASLAFVRGIHMGPVNSPHKGPVTRKMFPFDDVIMKKMQIAPGYTFARVFVIHNTVTFFKLYIVFHSLWWWNLECPIARSVFHFH